MSDVYNKAATCKWRRADPMARYEDYTSCGHRFNYKADMIFCPACGLPIEGVGEGYETNKGATKNESTGNSSSH